MATKTKKQTNLSAKEILLSLIQNMTEAQGYDVLVGDSEIPFVSLETQYMITDDDSPHVGNDVYSFKGKLFVFDASNKKLCSVIKKSKPYFTTGC